MLSPATITHVSYLGFAKNAQDAGFYSTGAWSGSAIADNNLALVIKVRDDLGNEKTNTYASHTMTHANLETMAVSGSTMPVGAG